MKLQNFTIRGNYIQVIGRVASNNGKDNTTVYDLDFPDGLADMTIDELKAVVHQLEQDLDSLFCYYEDHRPRDIIMQKFEETWEEVDSDAHGA